MSSQNWKKGNRGWGERERGKRTALAQDETQGQGFTSTDKYIKCLGRQALFAEWSVGFRLQIYYPDVGAFLICALLGFSPFLKNHL